MSQAQQELHGKHEELHEQVRPIALPVLARILGRRTAAIATFLIPHPRPTWFRTRILGRRTAAIAPFLIPHRALHGFVCQMAVF